MKKSSLQRKIANLPQKPGVYIFYGKSGESAKGGFRGAQIIYIGKATSLKSRVGSYFSGLPDSLPSSVLRTSSPRGRRNYGSRPIEAMIHEVADIKVLETDSVLEALVLESNLIKKHLPKYNVKEKDDKSFSYFVITKEKFPRVVILRQTELEKTQNPMPTGRQAKPKTRSLSEDKKVIGYGLQAAGIYGPYTSKKQMLIALNIVRKIFPFHSNRQQTEKGCLDFQIGRCPGPYAGAISRADYGKNIRGIRMILVGQKKGLLRKMEKEMRECAKKHEFEKAAEIRNKVFALQHIQDVALISSDSHSVERGAWSGDKNDARYAIRDMRIEAYDISNISGTHAVGSMVVFQNSQPDKAQYRKFKIKTLAGADDVGMMREVLLRRFQNNWPQPDLILLDGGQGHLNMTEKLLHELGLVIPLVAVAKGPTRKNLEIRKSKLEKSEAIENILRNKNLLKRIMDEAHRFAITYHKKLREANFL